MPTGKRSAAKAASTADAAAASLHARILADVRGRILSGEWPPGHRIPFETELSEQFGCSRMTVNKVLSQLARSGLIERRRKAGSFVSQPRSQSAVLEIQDIKLEVEALGRAYGYRLLSREQRRATAGDRACLGAPSGCPVLALECLHLAGEEPFCVEQRLINLAAVPQAKNESFQDARPGAWLIAHAPWSEARHTIRAMAATQHVAGLLEITPSTACLVMERQTWLAGRPVTHVTLTYPGTLHELVAAFAPSAA